MPIFGTGPKRSDGRTNSILNTTPTYLTPTQVPNLRLWLDANDISTFVISSVSTVVVWRDKSQFGSHFSTNTGAPQLNLGTGVLFSNLRNDVMISLSTITITNGATTIFGAGGPQIGAGTYMITFGANSNDLSVRFGNGTVNQNDIFLNSPNYFNGSVVTAFPVPTTGFIVDGVVSNTSAIAASYTSTIGLATTFLNRGYGGYMKEILFYNSALSDNQRRGVEAYLARKWGTQSALPYRHPGLPTGPPLMGYRLITYPRLVSNYALWYDAMDTSTIKDVGGNFPPLLPPNALGVGQWNDKSGNNRHLSNFITNPSQFNLMSPGTFYPAVFSPGYIGGFPTLGGYFNLRSPTTISYTGSSISAFFVLSVSPNANDNTFFSLSSTNNGTMPIPINPIGSNVSTFDFSLNYISNTIGFSRFGGGGAFGLNPRSSNNIITAPFTTNTTTLVSMFINGDSTTLGNVLPSTNLISINGAFVSSSTTYSGRPFNLQYISMFGNYNFPANSVSFFNEVAIFYRTLTTPERLLIENQLINKWKLPSNAPVSFINSLPVTSGLFGWYDAYDQTTVLRNGSNNVSMWLDKSGQSNHMSTNLLTYGSNTRSNIYYSSISISTNQLPSLFFPSTFAFMQTSSLITNQSLSTFTMMAVTRGTKIPTVNNRTVTFFSTLNDLERAGAAIGVPNNQVANTIVTVNQNSSNYSTFHINTLLANIGPTTDTGIASGNAVTYFNGSNSNLGTGLTYNGMLTPSYIRLMASAFTDEVSGDPRTDAGYLGEVLMYNRILNTTELSNVHSYLLNKWNISTLVSNVPVTRGLNLWLDAYDPATVIFSTNTNLVQQWRDKSISTLHFSNALTSGFVRPPTYTTNPANNLPGLLFSNSASIYATGIYNCNFNYPVTKEATIFTVAQWSSGNASYYSPVFCMLSNNEIINNTSNNFIVVGPGNGGTVGLYRGSPGGFLGIIGNTIDRPTLVTGVFNSSFSTSVILDIPQNHAAVGRNGMIGFTNISSFISTLGDGLTITATNFNVNQAVLGLRAPAGGDATWFHSGYIHEVLLYNRTLSFVERQQVESYLLSKWYI